MSCRPVEKVIKNPPYKLTVEDSKLDDNSIVEISAIRMEELRIMKGDVVIVRGKFSFPT